MKSKRCSKCGEVKAVSEFAKHDGHKDGLHSSCQSCVNARNRERRVNNREHALKRDRAYRERKRERKREIARAWRNAHPESLESARKWREANPAARRAHQVVRIAIRAGRLTKLDYCERCGADECRIEAHHDDYSRPLDVQWWCVSCHQRYHHADERRANEEREGD